MYRLEFILLHVVCRFLCLSTTTNDDYLRITDMKTEWEKFSLIHIDYPVFNMLL